MKVLVLNAGSSSIKYQLYEMPGGEVLCKGNLERIGDNSVLTHKTGGQNFEIEGSVADHYSGMGVILDTIADAEKGAISDISEIDAVGHRVVHGGEEFTGSVEITDEVISSIERFADLAPLHNPPNLSGIRSAEKALPNAVQAACFDTAFHTSIPKKAYIYGLPYKLYEKYRIRRYGFHGTSHRYVSQRAAELLGRNYENVNLITAHLGNGCSLAAVRNGKSVDTSMGLTPLEGVVMGTRSGDMDPAIIFYLAEKGYSVDDLKAMCNKESGLLGISGSSNDMRNLVELSGGGDDQASLAIDIFAYRIKKYIGAYSAVLGRVDSVVFTGGIGENNAMIRGKICGGLEQIGCRLDDVRNNKGNANCAEISAKDSQVKVFIIPTDEEAAIAGDTYEIAKGKGR
jgi:acetate kinase